MRNLLSRGALGVAFLLLVLLAGPGSPAVHSADLVVISPADSGYGTLRWALLSAGPGEKIIFSPAVFPPGDPVTIWVQSALPTMNRDNVTLDASNTGVILNGAQTPPGTKGLIVEADNCTILGLTIREFKSDGIAIGASASWTTLGGDQGGGDGPNGEGNLVVANGASGIAIQGDNNAIRGNYIGTDGTWDAGNSYNGVSIWDGASGNVVGGASAGGCDGYCNVISGNDQNGVWIGGAGSDLNIVTGNYIGVRADGLGPVPNTFSGVAIQGGPQGNRVGGTVAGEGNLISGNADHGVYISDAGTRDNRLLGNLIGLDRNGTGIIGQGDHGVILLLGASYNVIGDGTVAGRNLIGGNSSDGVCLVDAETAYNMVQGNFIGTNADGSAALPNGVHGVEIMQGAHHNQIGGNRLLGEGNLLSGNAGHGVVISSNAHDNLVQGNLVGPDVTGSYSLGYHPQGGIDISNGAHHNVLGGLGAGEGNVVSGNRVDGICLFKSTADVPADNELLGNLIGVAADGTSPLPNEGFGVLVADWVLRTRIEGNTIAFNQTYGVLVATCGGHTITRNSIHSNGLAGIDDRSHCVPVPQITGVAIGSTETITGTAVPGATVEFFSDDQDEGRLFEGDTQADASGSFVFGKVGGFAGPNLTATSTDASGNTSAFASPTHLAWTMLLYLSGDNDLDAFMVNTLTNTVAAGASPQANVLALVDGYTTTMIYSPTVVYDLTYGEAVPLNVTWNLTGELNMGSGQTLVDFVTWGQAYRPARHTLLAIVDHGGGWAPSSEGMPGAMPVKGKWAWMAGNSGLSWDFGSDMDYLGSQEIRQAMAVITGDGARPLDVVFYDVCLMGMTEVAYQIKEYAAFFVSSQNVAWAPLGPDGRYVEAIQGLPAATTPHQMAQFLVEAYANSMPADVHPFTISAVDLAAMPTIANGVHQLAEAISQTLAIPAQVATLNTVYNLTQKLDYDSDFQIEPSTDGFVDLYDLALKASQRFADEDVVAAALNLMTALDSAIVAEEHRSGNPWVYPERMWDLDDAHGLSIFLPLGEDRIITTTWPISNTGQFTQGVRLREMYTCEQLQFVCDTTWGDMIETYYAVAPLPPALSSGAVGGLLPTDVTPPQTAITMTGEVSLGGTISLAWVPEDAEAGVYGAALWHRPPHGEWTAVLTKAGTSGVFSIVLSHPCTNAYAVRGIDRAGNVEPLLGIANQIVLEVPPCERVYLPLCLRWCAH
ncbi:MAG: right-handed parallel beta-helix repeat-containing protein [Anaerolineae bacterium]|nr:right-handed parallel beta-helix repeat-containing protein [Anaerolineae bacterium]